MEQWLENLRAAKADKNVSYKWISEVSGIPERSVKRIFSGETDSPKHITLKPICTALDTTLDEILSDTAAFLSTKSLAAMRDEVERLTAEVERLSAENGILSAENVSLRDNIVTITTDIKFLKLELKHKEELLAVHDYYMHHHEDI